ncbi:MAG: DUF1361 domain-containing protein [Thermoanaerobaculia bacterium]
MSGLRRALAYSILLLWCGVLLIFRIWRTHTLQYGFLAWNLFLAAVPLIASSLLLAAWRRRTPPVVQVAWFAIWLLFLPNAPYILTDFIHLAPSPPMPLWYDIALLGSAAGTGMLFAFASTAAVQRVVTDESNPATGWAVVVLAFLLSGFGIYLGRFLRWNSWDTLAHARALLEDAITPWTHPLEHPRVLGVTLIYGVGLTLGYAALHMILPRRSGRPERDRPGTDVPGVGERRSGVKDRRES